MKKKPQEIKRPTQISDAQKTADDICRLSMAATEISFVMESRRAELRDLEAKLAEVKKAYAALKPNALGLLAVLE